MKQLAQLSIVVENCGKWSPVVCVCVCMYESIEEQGAGVSCDLLHMFILTEQAGMSLLLCWGAILGAMPRSILT